MKLQLFQQAQTPYDVYTQNPTYLAQMSATMSGIGTYTTFFDQYLPVFKPPAFIYQDALAIFTDQSRNSARANANIQKWVLKDASGNLLYIPYGTAGDLPQYIADIGNPEVIQYMLSGPAANNCQGYKGTWLDDCNAGNNGIPASNENLVQTVPIDPRTGAPMTWTAWQTYLVAYLKQFRAFLKGFNQQVVQNTVWYAGQNSKVDPLIDAQIQQADFIWSQYGVTDQGLQGGDTSNMWSLDSFLTQALRVQKNGASNVFGGYVQDGAATPSVAVALVYTCACMMMVMDPTKSDAVGPYDLYPSFWDANFKRLFSTDFGNPIGAYQRSSNGFFQRAWANGLAVAVEPGASPVTFKPGPPCIDAYTGTAVTAPITLSAKQGGIYLYT